MKGGRSASDVALGVLGISMFLLLWQIIGTYRLAGLTWPPLTDVIETLTDPNRTGLFLRGAKATYSSAAIGFTLGTALGLVMAIGVHLAPPLRLGMDRLASVVNALAGHRTGADSDCHARSRRRPCGARNHQRVLPHIRRGAGRFRQCRRGQPGLVHRARRESGATAVAAGTAGGFAHDCQRRAAFTGVRR